MTKEEKLEIAKDLAEKSKDITKTDKKDLKTTSDRYIDTLSKEAEKVMSSMGLELKAEVKSGLFNLGLACEKTIKDKGIGWEQVNKDGLPSKLLYYAQLNLNPANNELYILPYKKGDKYVLEFEESYLGKKKKIKKFSSDKLIDAISFVVREGDIYEPDINILDGDTLEFKPKSFNNGPIIGAVCYLRFENSSKNRIIEMSLEELEKIKEASKAKMGGKLSPAWQKWESEMYKKAVLKRALKDVYVEVPADYQTAYMCTEEIDNANYDLNFEERKSVVINDETEEILDAIYEERITTDENKEEPTNAANVVEFE